MDVDEPLAITVTEAARLLGISRAFAYTLVNRGALPSLRLGYRIVVPRRALEELVDLSARMHAPDGRAPVE
jgi:excisionase family DNA binding protein